jgi:hypothetical protein
MAWDDAMRVISDETQELIDQVRDPDCDHVGQRAVSKLNGEQV